MYAYQALYAISDISTAQHHPPAAPNSRQLGTLLLRGLGVGLALVVLSTCALGRRSALGLVWARCGQELVAVLDFVQQGAAQVKVSRGRHQRQLWGKGGGNAKEARGSSHTNTIEYLHAKSGPYTRLERPHCNQPTSFALYGGPECLLQLLDGLIQNSILRSKLPRRKPRRRAHDPTLDMTSTTAMHDRPEAPRDRVQMRCPPAGLFRQGPFRASCRFFPSVRQPWWKRQGTHLVTISYWGRALFFLPSVRYPVRQAGSSPI